MRNDLLRLKYALTGDVSVSALEHAAMICVAAFALVASVGIFLGDFN